MNFEKTPKQSIIHLSKQPRFPMEDLNEDNTEVLKYILANEAGLDTYSQELEQDQHLIYTIAHRALRMLGLPATSSPHALRAFSHGFAGFETINDLVHEPRTYATAPATSRIADFLVDTRDLVDIQIERELTSPVIDDDETETIGEGNFRLLLSPRMEDALKGIPSLPFDAPIGHDKTEPEKIFTTRHALLAQKYPHTFDVIVSMGEARNETMAQLQLRIAGAGLARTLQTSD